MKLMTVLRLFVDRLNRLFDNLLAQLSDELFENRTERPEYYERHADRKPMTLREWLYFLTVLAAALLAVIYLGSG
jgi:hypothetical protein